MNSQATYHKESALLHRIAAAKQRRAAKHAADSTSKVCRDAWTASITASGATLSVYRGCPHCGGWGCGVCGEGPPTIAEQEAIRADGYAKRSIEEKLPSWIEVADMRERAAFHHDMAADAHEEIAGGLDDGVMDRIIRRVRHIVESGDSPQAEALRAETDELELALRMSIREAKKARLSRHQVTS